MKNFITSLHQNFIMFSKSPSVLIIIFLPLTLLFISGTIYPVSWILPEVITISIVVICFLSVGIQFNEYKISNFFRTTKNTNITTANLILGTFVVTFVITLFLSIFLMIVTWFFTSAVPVLSQTIDNVKIDFISNFQGFLKDKAFFSTFSFSNINWGLFIYSLVLSIVMTSLFSIFIGSLFQNIKTYILFTMIYLVVYLIVSGLVIPPYLLSSKKSLVFISNLIPNYHTNILIDSSLNSNVGTEIDQYTLYLDSLSEWVSSTYDFENNVINFDAFQEFPDIPGLDPIDTTIIFSILPWLNWLIFLLFSFFNEIGLGLSFETSYAIFVALRIASIIFDSASYLNFQGIILNFLNNISLTFKYFNFYQYAFNGDFFSFKVNIIPYIIILISFPFFIKGVYFL